MNAPTVLNDNSKENHTVSPEFLTFGHPRGLLKKYLSQDDCDGDFFLFLNEESNVKFKSMPLDITLLSFDGKENVDIFSALLIIDLSLGIDDVALESLIFLGLINVENLIVTIFFDDVDRDSEKRFEEMKVNLNYFFKKFNFKGDGVKFFKLSKKERFCEVCEFGDFFNATFSLEKRENVFFGEDCPSSDSSKVLFVDQFSANIFFYGRCSLYSGRSYIAEISGKIVGFSITKIKNKVGGGVDSDNSLEFIETKAFALCNMSLNNPIPFKEFSNSVSKKFFILDSESKTKVGVGKLNFPLSRASNLRIEKLDVNKEAYARQKKQKPVVVWFTGLSGSGKSTIANLVERKLYSMGKHTYILDGDNVRHGLNRDLGFTASDRVENVRRIGEVAKLMVDAGLITLVSFISPFKSEREQARSIVEKGEFIEVFVETPIEVCQKRDVKGLYAKAERGEIKNFTGISSPYEAPENPDIRLNTEHNTVEVLASQVIDYLKEKSFLK
jgi:adenylyl-sulfate kinase